MLQQNYTSTSKMWKITFLLCLWEKDHFWRKFPFWCKVLSFQTSFSADKENICIFHTLGFRNKIVRNNLVYFFGDNLLSNCDHLTCSKKCQNQIHCVRFLASFRVTWLLILSHSLLENSLLDFSYHMIPNNNIS